MLAGRTTWVFWLLVTATVCANAVAIYALTSGHYLLGRYALNLWSALILGQLSMVSIWLVFRQRHDVWSWILPPAALLVAAIARRRLGVFGSGWEISDYVFRSALQMLVSIIVLWLLIRTATWRKMAPGSAHLKWEFSTLQLLFWMTLTALMSALVARSTWSAGQPLALTQAIGILAPGTVAVSVVILATLNFHWLVRVPGYLIVGAMVGMCLAYFRNWDITNQLVVEFVAQAIIIAAWVEWGGIGVRQDRDNMVTSLSCVSSS